MRSLGNRLGFAMVVFVAIAFVVIEGFAARGDIEGSLWVAQFNKAKIAHVLASNMADDVNTGQLDDVKRTLQTHLPTALHQRLAQVEVFASSGERLLDFTPDAFESREKLRESLPWKPALLQDSSRSSEQIKRVDDTDYWVATPIVIPESKTRVGTLLIRYDVGIIQDIALERVTGQIGVMACLLVLFSLMILLTNRYMLTLPMRKVTETIVHLADGDNTFEIPLKGRSDEIGAIAEALEIFRINSQQAETLRIQTEEAENLAREQREAAEKADSARREEELLRLENENALSLERAQHADALSKRIEQLMQAVDAATAGDFSHRVHWADQNDDLQRMAESLARLFEQLDSSIGDISETAVFLSESAGQLTGLSRAISDVAAESAKQTASASATSERVNGSVDAAVSATQQMSSSISAIAGNAGEANSVAEQAVSLAQSAAADVRQLADSSAGIGNVIKAITSIAEQTNLLALNATIEAARAGDAGKGFAVVANEVKELAKETARATEEIEHRVASIQTDTGTAVSAINDINDIVGKISEIQATIAAAVEQQTSTTSEINHTIADAAQGNHDISTVIAGISQQTQVGLESSNQVDSASQQLTELADRLQSLVGRFRPEVAATNLKRAA